MSIISDDIWDKFEFEDNHVDTLLASFSTTHPIYEELIKNETDDWMEFQLPVDLVTKMTFGSSEQLQGYEDAINSVCPDCMWNGNCVRKKSKFAPHQPNYNTAFVKGRVNGFNAVRKLNFDACENNNLKFTSPKTCAFQETINNEKAQKLDRVSTDELDFPVWSQMHLMKQFDFGLAENDESQPLVVTKKRKKCVKNAPAITLKKCKSKAQQGNIDHPQQETNNNVDLYCYEKLNEKSLLWNNDRQRNVKNKPENVKLKSTATVQEETKIGYTLEVDDKQNKVKICAKILNQKNISTFSPISLVKKMRLNNVGSPSVHQSVKDFNFNDDQQNKTKLEIMNCYEILNLFDDKAKKQQIQVDTLDTAPSQTNTANHFNIGDKVTRNTRKEKDLRNQRDRERKLRLEQGYRELSQLVPELSLPQSKQLTVAQKRDILQKTAQYCSYLVNRNLVLRKEKESEAKKNFRLLNMFMFLTSGI